MKLIREQLGAIWGLAGIAYCKAFQIRLLARIELKHAAAHLQKYKIDPDLTTILQYFYIIIKWTELTKFKS